MTREDLPELIERAGREGATELATPATPLGGRLCRRRCGEWEPKIPEKME